MGYKAMIRNYRTLSILGLSTLMLGLFAIPPARADYCDYSGSLPSHIRRDIDRINRDLNNLEVLEDRRDEARQCRDFDEVHDLDARIRPLQRHIEDEKRDVKKDIDKLRRQDRDRDSHYEDSHYGSSHDNGSRYGEAHIEYQDEERNVDITYRNRSNAARHPRIETNSRYGRTDRSAYNKSGGRYDDQSTKRRNDSYRNRDDN